MLWTASASAVTVAISVRNHAKDVILYSMQLELDTGHFWSVVFTEFDSSRSIVQLMRITK